MPRASWKGFIRLSLVSVPVEGYTARNPEGSDIRLNMLHADCHSRIHYVKTCPIHGEVPNDEIVRGYEYSKDQYAIIDPDELDKLRTESDRAINIDEFFPPEKIDPRYFTGQSYFLVPDGIAGKRPYALLQKAMADENLYAVGQVVLSGKEQLVVLRPIDRLLAINSLHYQSEVRQPELFADQVDGETSTQEMKLTKMLIDASTTDHVDWNRYHDVYHERLRALIEAKIEGREVARPAEEELPPVINLMDALRASVEQRQTSRAASKEQPADGKPAKKSSPARKKKPTKKKRTG